MALSKEELSKIMKESAQKRAKEKYDKVHRVTEDGEIEKLCPICQQWKSCTKEYFYVNKSNKSDGLCPNCKKCDLKDQKEYQLKYVKEQKVRHRKWHIKNKESEIEKKKQYYYDNRDEKQEYFKQWRQSEKGRQIMREHGKKYSNKKHKITKKEWIACKDYFANEQGEWCCAYCGKTYTQNYEETHKDLHKEHVYYDGREDLKNCVPACQVCNSNKHQDSLNDWYNKNNSKYTYERYHKICQWIRYDCKKYIEKKKDKGRPKNRFS